MEENKYKYNCEKCGFKCNYESQWLKHVDTELHKTGIKKKRSDIKEPYKCDKCLYETKNIVVYKQHKLTEHGTKEEREKNLNFIVNVVILVHFQKIFMKNILVLINTKNF